MQFIKVYMYHLKYVRNNKALSEPYDIFKHKNQKNNSTTGVTSLPLR